MVKRSITVFIQYAHDTSSMCSEWMTQGSNE